MTEDGYTKAQELSERLKKLADQMRLISPEDVEQIKRLQNELDGIDIELEKLFGVEGDF